MGAARLDCARQSRSLSLWGWGSSKSPEDFAKAHPHSTSPTSAPEVVAPEPSIEVDKTVKASHSTSEAPAATSPGNGEPDTVQELVTPAAVPGDTPDLASIPEGLGYLKDVCGLDFGVGPTALMQFGLEHIHVMGGLSWTASIIALTFVLRGTIFPIALSASSMAAKFQELGPAIKELREKSQGSLASNDRAGAMAAQMEMRELYKGANLSFFKMFAPTLFQIPLGYGAWHLLRTASELPVPAFEVESFLWINSIAIGDPYYLLPAATAALTWFNFHTTLQAQTSPNPLAGMLRNVLPLVTFGFLCFQPGSVQIYFIANSFFTQLQLTSFQSPTFRRLLNMHPMPKPAQSGDGPLSRLNVEPKVINTTARPTSSSSIPKAAAPVESMNRSFIDKGVDSIKTAGKETWNKLTATTKEKAEQKALEKKREAQKAAAQRYEAQRKEDLKNVRLYRNAAARRQTTARGNSPPSKGG